MDFAKQGLTYVMLIIPTMFAGAVLFQGIVKLKNKQPGGVTVTVFGVLFLILIAAAYIFFIR
jgi:hypothetical protein